jgi:hypothetical protein
MKNGFIQKMTFSRIVEHQKKHQDVIVDACHNKTNMMLSDQNSLDTIWLPSEVHEESQNWTSSDHVRGCSIVDR